MAKIQVIADSSCDFTPEEAAQAGFSLVPLTVAFDDKKYIDGVELDSAHFFELLQNAKNLPKTSQPSPDAFMKEFLKFADCDAIICVCVTGKSSGTVNSAAMAQKLLEEEGFAPKIYIVDSMNASCAIALMAKTAASMAKEGKTAEEIMDRLQQMQKRLSIYFILDTLEFVRRGGRIGNISAIVGTILNIKPVLTFFKGSPTNIDKCRGFIQAKDKLVKRFLENALTLEEITIIHAAAFDRASALAEELKQKIAGIQVEIHEVGAVMGTYTGPGGIAIAFEEKHPRW